MFNDILMNIDISNPNVVPVVENDRVLIPLRFLSEGLGWSVNWDKNTKTVTATLEGRTVRIQLDTDKMFIDGIEYTLDVPARSINGRIFVPLRAFVENALGKSCFYNNGLIVISEKENTFDSTKDSALLNELIKELSAKKGNTSSNLVNYGYVVRDGDWIYYIITTNTEKNVGYGISYLYRAKPNGSQKKLLYSLKGFICDLQIVNNKIYFVAGELNEPDVYRMNTDGTGKIALSTHKTQEDKIWEIVVYGDYIYYKKDNGLYKMNLDGSNPVKILDREDIFEIISVEGNKIYFTIWDDLYSINTDGTNFKRLISNAHNYIVSNGFVYYTDFISFKETIIGKLDLSTGTETILKKFEYTSDIGLSAIDRINVNGEWIYYNDNFNKQIRRMKIDGTNDTVVSNISNVKGEIIGIYIAGDWIFYCTELSHGPVACENHFYKLKIDGSLNQIIK
ncbi:DUF5050 domain-containing protein [Thermovenabulum gondwanense]|nr:DUF5050 domain-containing protein [Thermovenabulum gondwanense]